MTSHLANGARSFPLFSILTISCQLSLKFTFPLPSLSPALKSRRAPRRGNHQVKARQTREKPTPPSLSALENPRHTIKFLTLTFDAKYHIESSLCPFFLFLFPPSIYEVVDQFSSPCTELCFFHSGDRDRGLVSRITFSLGAVYSTQVRSI